MEALIQALNNYEGGVLLVSHDQHFVSLLLSFSPLAPLLVCVRAGLGDGGDQRTLFSFPGLFFSCFLSLCFSVGPMQIQAVCEEIYVCDDGRLERFDGDFNDYKRSLKRRR